MKRFVFFPLLLILLCVSSVSAQPVVKVAVLRASDQPVVYKHETDAIRESMTEIQSFFASEMNRLGYGKKTFEFETNIPVYIGAKKLSEYEADIDVVRWQQGRVLTDFPDDIHLIFLAGASSIGTSAGTAGGAFTHRCDATGDCNYRRLIVMPLAGSEDYRNRITAHELGHAFGFYEHLTSQKKYLMESYAFIIPGEGSLFNFQLHPDVARILNKSKDLSVIDSVDTEKIDKIIRRPNDDEAEIIDKITGPWLWVIAPTAPLRGGAASIDVDSLAAASGGTVTELDVAVNGATAGNTVGNYAWTLGEITASEPNNINVLLNKIGIVNGGNSATTTDDQDINNHSSYALITLESSTEQSDVTMLAGSDDAIKVWLNGEVVHNNPVDRPAGDFQDKFKINLKAGDNLLMVKVSELFGSWSMFVGIDADVIVKQPSNDTVGKTTTSTPSTDANSTTTVSISPSVVPLPAISEQLTLSLYITDGVAVAGYQATVRFDTDVLRYIGSENGDYLSEGAFFVPPVVSGNTVRIAATTFSGESDGNGTLATLTFEVVAVKPSTLTVSEVILSNSESGLSYPDVGDVKVVVPTRLVGDVNGDGIVNIQDLVKVATSFGQTGQSDADVTGDGVVNIADLVKVAGIIGAGTSAPSVLPQALEILTAADVQLWLTQAQHLYLTDPTSQRGILALKQLLAVLMPKETALLPNYPNPFNPETWIPYELVRSSDVRITFYNTHGSVVRTLDLGHQSAGYYTDRGRAAYWDGRNAVGEPVASGVYFYTLSAGDFTATRKLLIRK